MSNRIDYAKISPAGYKAFGGVYVYLQNCGLSARECAALAWAETVTRVAETAVPASDYDAAAAEFSDKELADLTYAIGLMKPLIDSEFRSARHRLLQRRPELSH